MYDGTKWALAAEYDVPKWPTFYFVAGLAETTA